MFMSDVFRYDIDLRVLILTNQMTHYMFSIVNDVRITCPCKIYPLKPHFYIVKTGFTGVNIFSLFLLQNIDCGF